jgi:hypothetical protein
VNMSGNSGAVWPSLLQGYLRRACPKHHNRDAGPNFRAVLSCLLCYSSPSSDRKWYAVFIQLCRDHVSASRRQATVYYRVLSFCYWPSRAFQSNCCQERGKRFASNIRMAKMRLMVSCVLCVAKDETSVDIMCRRFC